MWLSHFFVQSTCPAQHILFVLQPKVTTKTTNPHDTQQKVICPVSCYFASPEPAESSSAPSTANTVKTLIFIIIQKQRLSHCSATIQVSTACCIATCSSLSHADNTDVPLRSNRHDSAWPATYSTLCPYRSRRTAIKCARDGRCVLFYNLRRRLNARH